MKKVTWHSAVTIIPIPSTTNSYQMEQLNKQFKKMYYNVLLSYLFEPEHRKWIKNYIDNTHKING